MWGANGKNHTWAMGHHRLVALLVFQATLVFADFGSNDSQNLSDCKSYLYSIREDVHALGLGGISTDVYYILTELESIDTSVDEIEIDVDTISRVMSKFGDAILTPTSTQIKNQIAVTNVAETYWLEKIYDALTIGGPDYTGYTVYSPYIYSRDGVTTYQKAIDELMNGVSQWENGQIDDATFFNRYGAWLERVHDFASHIDYNLLSSLDERSVYLNVLSRFGPSLGPAPRRRFLEAYQGISSLYQSQYGTYILQNMSTNTFLSGVDVNNFFTNGVFLSQYSTNAFQHIADSSGINTNGMFLGSYGSETNSDILAEITTNGLELVGSNKDYSSLGADVDSGSLSNKVSRFDFTQKFDDSIKPFLDEIENASGGDLVIRFGNVDLGDNFSFTIPDQTIERNETFLGYVDHFLNVLKIILTFVFFLTLWHQLGNAVEGT